MASIKNTHDANDDNNALPSTRRNECDSVLSSGEPLRTEQLVGESPGRGGNSSPHYASESDSDDEGEDERDEACESSDDDYEFYGGGEYFTNSSELSNDDDIVHRSIELRATSSSERKYSFINRVANPRLVSKKRKRWIEEIRELGDDELKDILCCKKRKCFQSSNVDFLRAKMKQYRQMSEADRRRTLTEMMGSDRQILFDGRRVCTQFLKKAFRFSPELQKSVTNSNYINTSITASTSTVRSATITAKAERNQSSENYSPGRDSIVCFLERLADSTGDRMPDINEIHLPFFKKRDVYNYFVKEFKQLHPDPSKEKLPTRPYFYSSWKRCCDHIKVRKLGRFAKCAICEQLREARSKALIRNDLKELKQIQEQKKQHNEFIARERREYKKKRDMSKLHPSDYLSIIVDGADQSAFGLPHFMVKTKDDRGHSLKVRLIGLLGHYQENRLRLFTLTEEYPTGANHIVEAIHRYLNERINQSVLPRILFIQLDNCIKENKNRYLFAYMESLIHWNIFDEVTMGFLPVGHTHEDIDQTFSRTSDRLRSNNAITLGELHEELRHTYNEHTVVGSMSNVINWSGLCEDQNCLTKVKLFSKYRYFKFSKAVATPGSSNITTRCLVRFSCTDEWENLEKLVPRKEYSSFIKFAPDLKKTPPLAINCPEGKEKVTECLEAAEGRIGDNRKLNELLEMRDSVFNSRVEQFHWDLSNCIETNKSKVLRQEEAEEEEDSIEPNNTNGIEDLRPKLCYELNSFVAVKPHEPTAKKPFWVAKINRVFTNNDEITSHIEVHWYDVDETSDVYQGKYYPVYMPASKKKEKKKQMKDKISVDAVIVNFRSFTKLKKLPATVMQHLKTTYDMVN